tara:strand:+ start:12096 stop:12368 length:273 start_codon:yes stop_codon:yes gene_type:complete
MKGQLVRTLKSHFLAKIENHRTNIQIMLDNPQSIPEHSDWIETVEKEVEKLAHYNDLHSSFCFYFGQDERVKTQLNENTDYTVEHVYTNT